MISREDIKKLAALARITVSDKEADAYAEDAEAILSYVSQIDSEEGQKEGDSHTMLRNVMREDGEPHESGAYTKDILADAPNVENDYLVVRKVINKE
jgi:aspartyl/glutamyl-tRNA(Asn/Gln) amidotransferase C subunit